MNVVFLCQRVPYPPDRGDRITTWHFLQHLLKRGANVRLGCFTEEDRDDAAVEFLSERCDEVCAPRLHRGMLGKVQSMRGLLTGEAVPRALATGSCTMTGPKLGSRRSWALSPSRIQGASWTHGPNRAKRPSQA